MTRTATDEEVSLWYCETCIGSGVILLEPHASVYEAVNVLERAHKAEAPGCKALIGEVRVVRPDNWYRVLSVALTLTDVLRLTDALAEANAKEGGECTDK